MKRRAAQGAPFSLVQRSDDSTIQSHVTPATCGKKYGTNADDRTAPRLWDRDEITQHDGVRIERAARAVVHAEGRDAVDAGHAAAAGDVVERAGERRVGREHGEHVGLEDLAAEAV